MVWYRYEEKKKGLKRKITRKFIKKFKDGKPDLEYFGSGMCANYLYDPHEIDIKAYEIFPTLKETNLSLSHIVTDAPRSFELYKTEGVDIVRFVIRSIKEDIESYAKSLDVVYTDLGSSMMPIIKPTNPSNYVSYFFDFELENQFNFTGLEQKQIPLINRLIRAMTSSKNCGIMIQFLFTRSINWNEMAKFAASKLTRYLRSVEIDKTKHFISGFDKNFTPTTYVGTVPKINELSSFTYQTGKILETFYHKKARSPPITLAIRGMIIGTIDDIKVTIRNVLATFSSIRFVGDSLSYFDYEVDQEIGIKWLENNDIGTNYATEILRNNSNMWSDMRWGIGRDFVPFLCLTDEEFPIFVSFPTDQNLPVSFGRQKLKVVNYEKSVFPLGNVI